jgi:hypothetical protein
VWSVSRRDRSFEGRWHPRPAGFGLSHTAAITLSPLTPDEIATLEAQGLTPPPLWVRDYQAVSGECDDSAVVAQRFENWQDVAPIGDYPLTDPYLVRVPGEDEPRRLEDMP